MFKLNADIQVYLHREPIDFRAGIEGGYVDLKNMRAVAINHVNSIPTGSGYPDFPLNLSRCINFTEEYSDPLNLTPKIARDQKHIINESILFRFLEKFHANIGRLDKIQVDKRCLSIRNILLKHKRHRI